jgi:GR25 family glycosyltransferase involved in LPS biosynthesis
LACKLSHLKALEIPCDSKYRLILEDDFDPVDNFLFRKSEFEQAPSNFDFLYLGANHTDKPVSYNEFFSKVSQASTTHAYIIREAAVSSVISDIKSSAKQIDLIYRDLQYYDKYRFYCCNANLINQRNTFSDIIGDFVNYDFMK